MEKKTCTFKGDVAKWRKFTKVVRENNMMVWGVLEPFVDNYLDKEKE